MYQIKRTFGISSNATHYEYRRIARGEYGEVVYKSMVIPSSASMKRIYKLTNGNMASSRTKQVQGSTYRRLMEGRN
jgi:hypothetical protein